MERLHQAAAPRLEMHCSIILTHAQSGKHVLNGEDIAQATPQKAALDPSPRKGFGKLSPARWGWGKGFKKAAARTLAAETCSPLRDGASAMSRTEANSQTPKGRRRLSPKKMSPWLGK